MADRPILPSYRRPPVTEVVYGVAFAPLPLLAPHTGLYWSKIRDSFPKVQHAAPVGPLPHEFELGNLPLPRIWFVSEDDNYIVQVQSNRFLFNWRIVRPDDVYPRFEVVQKGFKRNFALFEEFVKSNDIGELELASYELTYINHIERKGELKNVRNASMIFQDLRWRTPNKRYLPEPSHLTWSAGFEFPDKKGRLVADIKPALRQTDQMELFVLQLKATGNVTAEENCTIDWFRSAREWIVRGFADLTTKKAQIDMWGLENPDD